MAFCISGCMGSHTRVVVIYIEQHLGLGQRHCRLDLAADRTRENRSRLQTALALVDMWVRFINHKRISGLDLDWGGTLAW